MLREKPYRLFPVLWIAILAACLPLLQVVPNGADHYFMIDVGETQIVLNNWGTLHPTGYPHFVMLGNLLTVPMRMIGIEPLVASGVVSLLWGILAAELIYLLMAHITRRPWLSLAVTLLYCLTRTAWIHFVIAEIYMFGLVILVGLLLIALWQGEIPGWSGSPYARIYWLALLGGIGVAHHRGIAMVAPALIFAVWPQLTRDLRKLPTVVAKSLGLGLLGFLPYAYLMIRARAGAAWVYGEPGTWGGLWTQFSGAEGTRFIGLPETPTALWANFAMVSEVVLTDVTWPGLILGAVGLVIGLRTYRRAALTMWFSAGVAFGFHVFLYTDILSALILPVSLSLSFGWLFLADALLRVEGARGRRWVAIGSTVSLLLIGVIGFSWLHAPFIHALVTDERGIETIEMARDVPAGATLMIPWGPRHFAVGYERDIMGRLDHLTLVDHTADYAEIMRTSRLVVPEYIRYDYPQAWWEARMGEAVYVQGVAPDLVELRAEAETVDSIPLLIDSVTAQERLTCTPEQIMVEIAWLAPADQLPDRSVFMHLMDTDGNLLAQDDRIAPVYGWRPLSTWQPGEIIKDHYSLPNMEGAYEIRFGLYQQMQDGSFENDAERVLRVDC